MSGMRLHEAFYFPNVTRDGIIGKRRDKDFTILHALDAVIQNRQHSAVSARANQSSESLLQREHRFRHLIFAERVAPFFLQSFHARGYDGITGHVKRKTIHDYARKLIAGNVHTLPETCRRE